MRCRHCVGEVSVRSGAVGCQRGISAQKPLNPRRIAGLQAPGAPGGAMEGGRIYPPWCVRLAWAGNRGAFLFRPAGPSAACTGRHPAGDQSLRPPCSCFLRMAAAARSRSASTCFLHACWLSPGWLTQAAAAASACAPMVASSCSRPLSDRASCSRIPFFSVLLRGLPGLASRSACSCAPGGLGTEAGAAMAIRDSAIPMQKMVAWSLVGMSLSFGYGVAGARAALAATLPAKACPAIDAVAPAGTNPRQAPAAATCAPCRALHDCQRAVSLLSVKTGGFQGRKTRYRLARQKRRARDG